MLDPNRAAIVIWSAGTTAGALTLAFAIAQHNTSEAVVVAVACATAMAAAILTVRLALGTRIPFWFDQLNVSIATILISTGAAVDGTTHVDFADFYVWIALHASLYFRPRVAALQISFAGFCYAVVLTFSSRPQNPFAAWFTTFGTAAVLAVVVFGLVGKLRTTTREDPLTQLANRRYWDERVAEEVERARRQANPLSLVLMDINDFKEVNDQFGHQAGDRLLCQFAQGWQSLIRSSGDFLARLGGDEFGLLVPNADEHGIELIAQKLRGVSPDGISCSYGVATWDGCETLTQLFRRADEALYEAKGN